MQSKDRYTNITCPPSTQFVISDGTYINASRIKFPSVEFVATQWPLENTKQDFWKMVKQYDPQVIIAFSLNNENTHPIYWESAQIHNTRIPKTIKRLIKISEKQQVVHYECKWWPDHGIPDSDCLSLMISSLQTKGVSRVIVHCSAGVGRTGSFVALYGSLTSSVSIDEAVRVVRNARNEKCIEQSQLAFLKDFVNSKK